MADAYVLTRRIWGRGGSLSIPIRVFDSEINAKAASAGNQADFVKLLDAQLVFRQGDEAIPIGMSLRDFLNSIGVEQAGHEFHKVPSGLIDEAPAPKIILSS